MESFQSERLRELVRHAVEDVPFYRKLYGDRGLNPAEIRGLGDLEQIPFAYRSQMQEAPPKDLVARGFRPDRLIVHRTSGSTGQFFSTRRTWFEERLLHGIRLREHLLRGVRLTDVRVRVSVLGHGMALSRTEKMMNRLGLLRKPIVSCLLPAAEILKQVAEFRPDVLIGYPDALAWISSEITSEHRKKIRPRLILTGGETLTADMRRQISEGFQTRVFDLYGSHEYNVLACECPQTGLYHVTDDSVILEVLRDGKPVGPGESGEVFATALHSFAMPFIRYWVGDVATRGPLRCPCGAPYSTLESIQGRVIDRFILPDGTKLHPYHLLEPLVNGAPWLRRYQLIQERIDRILFKVVPLQGQRPGAEEIRRVESMLKQPLGPRVELVTEVVETLPPAGSGKFRPYCSLVTEGTDPA